MAKASKKASTARPRTARKRPGELTNSSDPQTPDSEEAAHRREAPIHDEMGDRANTPERGERPDREPSEDEVARRAYEIYVSRGQEPGRHEEDWLQAKRELDALRGRGPTA